MTAIARFASVLECELCRTRGGKGGKGTQNILGFQDEEFTAHKAKKAWLIASDRKLWKYLLDIYEYFRGNRGYNE